MNLRQLSRQLARGQIDRAQYQRRRAELIEQILASLTGTGEQTDPRLDEGGEAPGGDRPEN